MLRRCARRHRVVDVPTEAEHREALIAQATDTLRPYSATSAVPMSPATASTFDGSKV